LRRLNHHQIVMTTIAATIGAMAAAWSIQQEAQAAAPKEPMAAATAPIAAPRP
jgi:hypothetical protein